MSASQIREYPFEEIFSLLERVSSKLRDLDETHTYSESSELPSDKREEARKLYDDCREQMTGLSGAIGGLMLDIDDFTAYRHLSQFGNRLDELAEQVIMLNSDLHELLPEQPAQKREDDDETK